MKDKLPTIEDIRRWDNQRKGWNKLIFGSFVFWIIETIAFLIIEGWHYKAQSMAESICDSIVVITMLIGIIGLGSLLTKTMIILLEVTQHDEDR